MSGVVPRADPASADRSGIDWYVAPVLSRTRNGWLFTATGWLLVFRICTILSRYVPLAGGRTPDCDTCRTAPLPLPVPLEGGALEAAGRLAPFVLLVLLAPLMPLVPVPACVPGVVGTVLPDALPVVPLLAATLLVEVSLPAGTAILAAPLLFDGTLSVTGCEAAKTALEVGKPLPGGTAGSVRPVALVDAV